MISIIIPVYKTEKFLCRCLDSIRQQTYKDWECILVDDGSTDNSGIICEQYAQSDNRFRVFHEENSGVSSARNLGLEMAKGEWITFIDSDDFISESYLENLYSSILKDNLIDIVNGSGTYYKDGKYTDKIEELQDCISDDVVSLFRQFKGYICGRLYKRELIEKGINGMPLRFDSKIRFSEDKIFMMQFATLVRKYAFSSECGYFYNRDNENSATHRITLTYDEAVYNFRIKYNIITSFARSHKIQETDIKKQFVSVARTLYPILCDINSMNMSNSYKTEKVRSDIGMDCLHILRYVPVPPFSRLVLKLFMSNRLETAFNLLGLSELEIKLFNKIRNTFALS